MPLGPGRWELDAAHSRVGFSIRHLGVSKVRGTFGIFEVEFDVGTTLADTSVRATIDVASVHTGVADRDAHILAPDLLDVASRPRLEFVSTDIRADGGDWLMRGDLTFGDVTAPIELEVEFGGAEPFPLDQRVHAGFEARGKVRRSDYGLDFGMAEPVVGNVVTIELDLQFLAPEA